MADWGFGVPQVVVLLVALQRAGELALARANTRRLLDAGAEESGRGHYPFFVLLHAGWLGAVFVLADSDVPVSWPLLGLYLALQAGRLWIIASLGPYWSTRVVTLPGMRPVRCGPYRYLRHPNYLLVVGELAILPLAFGLVGVAVAVSLLNLPLIAWRIHVEDRALAAAAARRGPPPQDV